MHDEFLHRLRKVPPPEFAAHLRAHLRRQPMSPPGPRAPSRVRTILMLLALGGTAFAVTYFVMRGLPQPVIELYRHATARIGAERATSSGHPISTQGIPEGQQWSTGWPRPPYGTPLRSGPIYSAAPPTNASPSPESVGGVATGAAPAGGALAGSQPPDIRVVASWAAYPYAVAIAEHFNDVTAKGGTPFPHIEVSARDSDHWPGLMCGGGGRGPDVAYAFEPVGTENAQPCPGVVAIPVGYEAVVLARSPLSGELDLTQRDVFLALAKWIPDSAPGSVHENTNGRWSQIDSALRPDRIEFMGPPLASAAGRSMIELLMERGCNSFFWIATLKTSDPARYAQICRTMRTDGTYTEVSGLTPSNLQAEPDAVGIFGLVTRTNPSVDALSISKLDGVQPTLQTVEDGSYPGSSAFYLYINRRRVPRSVGPHLLFIAFPLDSAYVAPPWPQYEQGLAKALGR